MPFILSKLTTLLISFLLITNGATEHHEDQVPSLQFQKSIFIDYNAAPVSSTIPFEPNYGFQETADVITCDMQGNCGLDDPISKNILPSVKNVQDTSSWQQVYKK